RLLVGDKREVFACPGTDRIDHPLQVHTRWSELVRCARRHLGVHGAAEESEVLEVIEADLERGRVAPADRAAKLVEAERTLEQGADDVHRPLLLQHLYGLVDGAILAFSIHVIVPSSQSRS